MIGLLLTCAICWIVGCIFYSRRRAQNQHESLQTRHTATPNNYSPQAVEMQVQNETSDNPQWRDTDRRAVNTTAKPDTTPQPAPDLSNSSLQEAPPPSYEAAENYSPPSSSAAFDSTSVQPSSSTQRSDLPPEDPSAPQISDLYIYPLKTPLHIQGFHLYSVSLTYLSTNKIPFFGHFHAKSGISR